MQELYQSILAAPAGQLGPRELPQSAFRDAVRGELRQPGVDRFDAVIMRGAPPDPPSDAFGPCFKRVPRQSPGDKHKGFEWVRVKGIPDDQCNGPT